MWHGLLSSCGPGALEPTGSVVMATKYGLVCPMAWDLRVLDLGGSECPVPGRKDFQPLTTKEILFKKINNFSLEAFAKENLGSGSRRGENGPKAASTCPALW